MPLKNLGVQPIKFEVDTSHLSDEFPVLKCLMPKGVLDGKESLNLDWIFSPVKYGPFEAEVPVTINDKTTINLKIQSVGLPSDIDLDAADKDEIPVIQNMRLPNQIASLSMVRTTKLLETAVH